MSGSGFARGDDGAWLRQGGDPARLAFYRQLGTVIALGDDVGRALVFVGWNGSGGCGTIGDFTGGAGLLARAEAALRALGVNEAIGPLDGNTFFPYRVTLGPNDAPVFMGEPVGAADIWRRAGWREDARYVSNLALNGPQIARDRGLPAGWTLRALDSDRFEEEIAALYRVTTGAFAHAWRYAPIPLAAFSALYAPFRNRIDPRWVLVGADPRGVVQAFQFAWPEREFFVIKTLAVHPEAQGLRLMNHFAAAAARVADSVGIGAGVHALMWEGAVSNVASADRGETIRRYALYRKRI